MNIMTSIGERNFQDSARSLMPEYVRIIGRVIGKVFIKDINKTVTYNTVLDIPVTEAQSSKDLVNAITNKWVDLVYGKEFIQPKMYNSEKSPVQTPVIQQQINQVQQSTIDVNDLKNYVVAETQKAVASLNETVVQVLNEVKKMQNTQSQQMPTDANLADVIAKQILQNLPITANNKNTKIEDKVAESVFIDIDEKKELKSNIKSGELGNLTTVKDKKAKSIASKLKNINKEGV